MSVDLRLRSDRSPEAVRLAVGATAIALAVGAYTILSIVAPPFRLALVSPGSRVVIEVTGLCALLFAAMTMSLLGDREVPAARDALVAALVVIALANALFGVGPFLVGERLQVDRGLALYPWVAARHLAGVLFLVAVLGRPRLGLRLTVGWALFALAVVELSLIATGQRLAPPVVFREADGTIEVVAPYLHVLLQAVPAVLFAVGSWFAGRLYLTTRAVVLLWLSFALLLQVFAQVHEVLYPAMLGPRITSADILRLAAFGLLFIGAVAQVGDLFAARTRTVRLQERDLRDQARLVEDLRGIAEKEELFRSIVSHELSTPLATIRNYTDVVAANLPPPRPAELDEALVNMRAEASRLLELVHRIDELRDVDDSGFHCDLRPVRIVPLLTETVRFLEGLDDSHLVRVECPDVRVDADPVRIGQLLRNLVVNAARFSPPGSAIVLRGRVDGPRLELSVVDRGSGIPEQERSLVIRRFGRGGNAVGTDGQGLGLYVAHRVAVQHGSRLQIDDGDGGVGTAVRVSLRITE